MSETKVCIKCGKEEQYAKQMCQRCYQADYRETHPKLKDEDRTDDQWREACKQPSKFVGRHCHFCGVSIEERYVWCKKCAIKHNLFGKKPSEWPEWARFLKNDLEREYRDDAKHRNQCEPLENEETGEIKGKVNRMDYQKYVAGTNEQRLNRSDISMEQLLRKYDIPIEELEILTASNLKAHAQKIGIPYHTVRRMKQALDQKWTWRMIAMMLPADTPTVLEFKHDLSECR